MIILGLSLNSSRKSGQETSTSQINESYEDISKIYDQSLEDLGLENLIKSSNSNQIERLKTPIVVKYNENLTLHTAGVRLVGELNENNTALAPISCHFPRFDEKFYSLMLLDIDKPTRTNPESSPWLHWLITNLKGDTGELHFLRSGEILKNYNPPRPTAFSNWHRYVFLIVEQNKKLTFDEITKLKFIYGEKSERANFEVKDFIWKVGGEICGAQMFRTKFEGEGKLVE